MNKEVAKKLTNRLHRIKGQIEGLERMVKKGAYCPDVITQSLSAQESLKGFNRLMLENHIREHIESQIKNGKTEQAVQELLSIYKLSGK